jgi:hypothetical protein
MRNVRFVGYALETETVDEEDVRYDIPPESDAQFRNRSRATKTGSLAVI